MSPYSIPLIDKRAALCRNPRYNRNVERGTTRAVCWSLMEDSRRQAEDTAIEIGACLEPSTGGADPCGPYDILKSWYRHASARVPNPSRTDMEMFRGGFQTLYQREVPHTPGLPLVAHISLAKVNYKIPSEAEVEAVVQRLQPHRAGGNTHLCVEHFKKWRQEAYPGE